MGIKQIRTTHAGALPRSEEPARFGGPYDFRTDPVLAERNREYVEGSRSGLDPLDLAALVMGAIEEEEFYIVTQPSRRGDVQARYDELMTAFDATTAPASRMALRLAREPDVLAELRSKLNGNRDRCALFDTGRFARNLEVAYQEMWERAQRGEPPDSFAVDRTS